MKKNIQQCPLKKYEKHIDHWAANEGLTVDQRAPFFGNLSVTVGQIFEKNLLKAKWQEIMGSHLDKNTNSAGLLPANKGS